MHEVNNQTGGYKDSKKELAAPILRPIMHPIQDSSKRRYVVQKSVKMFDRILVYQIQPKLAQNLLVHISVGNIRNIRVHHQRKQIENQVGALSEDDESRETEALEAAVVDRLSSTHRIDHLLADLDWRSENLRVSAQDISEVN